MIDASSRHNGCGSRIKHHPDASKAAILDYDTTWFGETVRVDWADQTNGHADPNLWVHAKLCLLGKNEPVALVYRIDVEELEDPEESEV